MKFSLRNILIGTITISSAFISCKDKDQPVDCPEFDLKGMLTNIGTNIIVPSYEGLESASTQLKTDLTAFTTNPTTATLNTARSSFKDAYLAWQKCSMFEFGPADEVSLRPSLNIYPTDTTQINSNVSAGSWNLDVVSNQDAKGFPAIDFLLFGRGDNEIVDWYVSATDFTNRKSYLIDLVDEIQLKSAQVATKWKPSGDNYLSTFTSNVKYDVGSSVGLLTNAMVLYYEKYIRDGKVAIPVGIKSLGIPLPEKTEAYYGEFSTDLANEAITAFKNMYLGKHGSTNGSGFDDHLIAYDETAVHNSIIKEIEEAEAALLTLNSPLSGHIQSDQPFVESVYGELQQVVAKIKVDLPSTLGILITFEDNDGD